MGKYDDLFAATAPDESVFTAKGALDPLAEPEEILARDDQEHRLATILQGVHTGYLPTTVSIYGPPGTGKTTTTRRVCREFAARTDALAVEYVNLKECRSLFSAANELHLALTGEEVGAYEGLDGVFDGIWTALESYPEWTVLILDEIDHIQHDSNYDPSDFFYRLLRGEGKQQRGITLSAWLLSNELLAVDLRLDSRVQSAMSGEEVFFPPYGHEELAAICRPRVAQAFRDGVVPDDVVAYGVQQAAQRWGDARKALRLFRQAGETADERGLDSITTDCLADTLETTDREAILVKLQGLPLHHLGVLTAAVARRTGDGAIVQPVTTTQIHDTLTAASTRDAFQLGERRIRDIVTDLATMGLVDTWIDSRGRAGRATQVETTFDPEWVRDAQAGVAADMDHFLGDGDDSTS